MTEPTMCHDFGEVVKATLANPQLIELMTALQHLQHDTSAWKDELLQPFSHLATELTVSKGGIILHGTQIVIPASLQHKAVHLAHKGHHHHDPLPLGAVKESLNRVAVRLCGTISRWQIRHGRY